MRQVLPSKLDIARRNAELCERVFYVFCDLTHSCSCHIIAQMVDDSEAVSIPLRWQSSDSVKTTYANQLIMSHAAGKEFYLIFGEVELPLIFGSSAPPPSEVKISTVARIAVTYEMAREIVRVLSDNVSRFERAVGVADVSANVQS